MAFIELQRVHGPPHHGMQCLEIDFKTWHHEGRSSMYTFQDLQSQWGSSRGSSWGFETQKSQYWCGLQEYYNGKCSLFLFFSQGASTMTVIVVETVPRRLLRDVVPVWTTDGWPRLVGRPVMYAILLAVSRRDGSFVGYPTGRGKWRWQKEGGRRRKSMVWSMKSGENCTSYLYIFSQHK